LSGNPPELEGDKVYASWSYYPMRKQPRKAVLLAAFLVAVWALAYIWFQLWGLFMAVLFTVGPLSGYILPSKYKLTGRGVEVKNLIHHQRFKWDKFVGYRDYPDAMQLYFDPRDLRGRLLKGVLMFYDGNRTEVRDIVEEHVESPEE